MREGIRPFVIVGLLVTLVLAGGVSYYASTAPDGLTRVAQDLGFMSSEQEHALGDSPLADYGTAGVGPAWLSGAIAGVTGVVVTFAIAGGLFLLVRRRTGGSGGAATAEGSGAPARDE
ncbi:PDGLE domain-containing protein [Salinactinospora qingdaonensis]|uniref:PDGLE domain-containing protein n=1 Tax=Salinactinospora qingdaonensis TaxID=702744 RepID=A0ABP7GBP2_9ACTN